MIFASLSVSKTKHFHASLPEKWQRKAKTTQEHFLQDIHPLLPGGLTALQFNVTPNLTSLIELQSARHMQIFQQHKIISSFAGS